MNEVLALLGAPWYWPSMTGLAVLLGVLCLVLRYRTRGRHRAAGAPTAREIRRFHDGQ